MGYNWTVYLLSASLAGCANVNIINDTVLMCELPLVEENRYLTYDKEYILCLSADWAAERSSNVVYVTFVGQITVEEPINDGSSSPSSSTTTIILATIFSVVGALLLIIVSFVSYRRWLVASAPQRRSHYSDDEPSKSNFNNNNNNNNNNNSQIEISDLFSHSNL